MRRAWLLGLLFAGCARIASSDQCTDNAGEARCEGVMMPLGARPYCLEVPPGAAKARPLVIVLHGYGSTPERQVQYFGLSKVARARGVLLASPGGTKNARGSRFWNAFSACCGVSQEGPLADDVAYLAKVIEDVKAKHAVSGVYLVGHSNGGFMAHRMACQRPDLVRGILSLAGTLEPQRCAPKGPLTVIQVHGDRDHVIPWEGGKIFTSTSAFASVDATMTHWARAQGCDARPQVSRRADLVCDVRGEESEIRTYEGCLGKVELWRIRGGVHVPRFNALAWPSAVLDALLH